jgi:hypothetical protein
MQKLIMILRIILLVVVTSSCIGQPLPQIFEPSIISNNGVFGFTLSPDETEAFWVDSNGGRDTLVILTARKVKGEWQAPTPATFSGKPGIWKDIDPVFSLDGKMVLFQSTRPVADKPGRTGFDIWAVKKVKNGWGEPYHLGNKLNTDDSESFASISKSGTLYFMKQNPDGVGSSDIYFSQIKDGEYQEAVNAGSPINSVFRESNPFISAKEDFIIFFRSDSVGVAGDVDLYISFRDQNKWSNPVALGNSINTDIGEFCPFYHEKQKRLYFARTVVNGNGRREENIYSVSFDPHSYRK